MHMKKLLLSLHQHWRWLDINYPPESREADAL